MIQVDLDDVLVVNRGDVMRRWDKTEKVLIALNENFAEVSWLKFELWSI